MHLFEGAVLAIRNPVGIRSRKVPEESAIEHISLLSLLFLIAHSAFRIPHFSVMHGIQRDDAKDSRGPGATQS
jgi:hypothetical protein